VLSYRSPENILDILPSFIRKNLTSFRVHITISCFIALYSILIGYASSDCLTFYTYVSNEIKFTLDPNKHIMFLSETSMIYVKHVPTPILNVYRHLRLLISQTLIFPLSSALITIGDLSINSTAVIIELCPERTPIAS